MSNDIKKDLINWNTEQLSDDSPVYNSKDLINALNSIMPSLGSVILTTNNHVLSKQEDWDSITINTLNMFTTLANSGLPASDFPNNSGILLVLGYTSYNIYIAISGEAVYYRLGDADWNKLLTSATVKDLTDSFATLTNKFSELSDQQTTLNNLFNTFKDDTNKQLSTLNTEATSQAKMLDNINNQLVKLNEGYNQVNDLHEAIDKVQEVINPSKLTYKTVSSTLYTQTDISDATINTVKKVGADLVMPIMATVTSSTDPNITMQDNSKVTNNIKRIQSAGIGIKMLKPHIGPEGGYDGLDRSKYNPSDYNLFFSNWKNLMLNYAKICNDYGIPILCIGCEQKLNTASTYLAKWKDIIDSIKSLYPGLLLTYAGVWNEIVEDDHNLIYQYLDLIGVNVYPAYTQKHYDSSITSDDLLKSWYRGADGTTYVDSMNKVSEKYNKPIFITETGSMPLPDGLMGVISEMQGTTPIWDGQALGYQATLEMIKREPNIIGVSFWNTNAPYQFSNLDKPDEITPTMQVLINYFKGGLI